MAYGHASMLLLGEGSEATEPYNKYNKIRPHSIRSQQFDQKVRPLSFRPEKLDPFTATRHQSGLWHHSSSSGHNGLIWHFSTETLSFGYQMAQLLILSPSWVMTCRTLTFLGGVVFSFCLHFACSTVFVSAGSAI